MIAHNSHSLLGSFISHNVCEIVVCQGDKDIIIVDSIFGSLTFLSDFTVIFNF